MSSSIIIVGAGIFGLTAAWDLRLRGWTVDVIDPGAVPRTEAASTDISKVVRMDYGADEFYVAMAEMALEGWDRWNTKWNPPLYHQDGFLVLAGGAPAPGDFEFDSFTVLNTRGHPVERLRSTERAVRFPAWSAERYPDGYFNPRAGWCESGKVVARVASEAIAAGARIREGVGFEGLIDRRGHVSGVRSSEGLNLQADLVLMTAGAWTPILLPDLATVMWTTGQPVVHFDVENPRRWQAPHFPVWAADISRTGWYGFPALDDGTLKIGHHGTGRRVHPDDPRVVLPNELERFRGFVRERLPSLGDAPIRATRLCLYCDTFDGDFWIDHDPARPGLVVAAGDSGHGFKFAPILGELIADVVEAKPNRWAPRFRWRPREREAKEAARSGNGDGGDDGDISPQSQRS